MRAINKLILYIHFLFFALRAGNLNMPGNKFNPNGYNIEVIKLIKVSFIKIFCVFVYTAQKQDIKYQKNDIKIKLIKKNKINFILKHDSFCFDFLIASFILFSSFISKIFFSDKDNCFNIIFIIAEITEEYKI